MSDVQLKTSDVLALERTRLAADRTLMAWLRTALSMITFGFTVYKFLQYLQADLGSRPMRLLRDQGPRNLGLTLIGLGTFSLIIACIQHWKYLKKLRPDQPYKPLSLTLIVAWVVGVIGLLAFFSILFSYGPFE